MYLLSMLYSSMFYSYYCILYLGYCCRMVAGMRSSVRGCSLGRGQGKDISVHESIHESPIQEGTRVEHVSEHQEENHREQ